MKIWIINNYNSLPEHGQMTRHYNFGKCLKEMGHRPVVFVGSHTHNTDDQLIEGPEKFKVYQEEPFPWVLVKTLKYGKSRKKQVLSMFQFYLNGKKAARYAAERYGKPDVVLGSSAHPLAALLAVRLAKKYGCRSVVEIRDLWPESIVAYGIAGPHNPAVLVLRRLEKWLYRHADAVVFTMEGAYDYIEKQGWSGVIPRSKVFFVNNGVDLDAFTYNREHFRLEDPDLDDPETFKVVYTGSIRQTNYLGVLVDAAKNCRNPRVRFLVWGDGDDLPALRRRVKEEGIENLIFKGRVEKKYVPSIVSRADLNFMEAVNMPLLREYGDSVNKMFEYFAAEKPILLHTHLHPKYSPGERYGCVLVGETDEEFLQTLEQAAALPEEEYEALCRNARKAAEEYDFKVLTGRLMDVLEGKNA